jgi:hypothetical protein
MSTLGWIIGGAFFHMLPAGLSRYGNKDLRVNLQNFLTFVVGLSLIYIIKVLLEG